MKVFFAKTEFTQDYFHLLVSYSWEKNNDHQNSILFNQLMVLRAQFFCEDQGRLHYKYENFTIVPYDREKHLKKLCLKCVLKAKRSKRHGPIVSG